MREETQNQSETATQPQLNLLSLPTEVIAYTSNFLPYEDLAALMQVCHLLYDTVKEKTIYKDYWKKQLLDNFSKTLLSEFNFDLNQHLNNENETYLDSYLQQAYSKLNKISATLSRFSFLSEYLDCKLLIKNIVKEHADITFDKFIILLQVGTFIIQLKASISKLCRLTFENNLIKNNKVNYDYLQQFNGFNNKDQIELALIQSSIPISEIKQVREEFLLDMLKQYYSKGLRAIHLQGVEEWYDTTPAFKNTILKYYPKVKFAKLGNSSIFYYNTIDSLHDIRLSYLVNQCRYTPEFALKRLESEVKNKQSNVVDPSYHTYARNFIYPPAIAGLEPPISFFFNSPSLAALTAPPKSETPTQAGENANGTYNHNKKISRK